MAQLDDLKTMLQIGDADATAISQLELLISICEDQYLKRTHQTAADEPTVNAMVIEKWNKMGNEGISSIGYSGISEAYSSDYSDEIQKLLRSQTRLVVL